MKKVIITVSFATNCRLMTLLLWIVLSSILCKVSGTAGFISTLIGFISGDDGPATNANIINPTGVVLDTSGNTYIGSFYDYKIRKVSTTGTISSIVGSGIGAGTSGSVDGSGTSASVNIVYGLVLDSSNNVYIADTGNSKIRKLTVSTGIVSTYACTGLSVTSSNGIAATSSGCYYPYAVALDNSNNVYIADTYHNQVRKVSASTGIIAAFAGTSAGGYSGDNGQAISAQLYLPAGLALDSTGNVYISDTGNRRVRKVTILTGVITTIAGTGTSSYSGDNGPATSAGLNGPYGITLDASDNVYIADFGNHRILKVTISTGIITTIAGTGTNSYTGDGGQATSATLGNPVGVYYYSSSSSVYIGDFGNRVVRKISSTGVISTVAGHTYDTTQSTSLALSFPCGVAVDSSGNVYVSEYSGHKVKKMTVSTGLVSDIAGTGSTSSSGDGAAATSAGIYSPSGLAVDSSGNVYIAEALGYRIRKLTVSTGIISTVVGTGSTGSCTSGSVSTTCKVNNPMAVEVDSSGNVYYSDSFNYKVMKYTASSGIVTTVAGSGSSSTGGDGGAATSAGINKPYGFVFDASGNIIISEYLSHKVRKVTVATGFISTIAGTGTASYSGDGSQATAATLYCPSDVAIDSYGDIYISDSCNNMIRKITVSTGIISTIAGSSTTSYTGNNVQATSATFNKPFGIAIDSANNIYITDTSNSAVRKIVGVTSSPTYAPTVTPSTSPTTILPTLQPSFSVSPTYFPSLSPHSASIISTIAGTGVGSYNGDGGQATSASINYPLGIAIDASGNVYFSDWANHRVRKITTSTGIITTYAGTGSESYNGDGGAASSAAFRYPNGLCIDSSDNLYIGDYGNSRVRKISASTSIISTIAGTGASSYSGDNGQATSAALALLVGVAVDTAGNVYIGDRGNNRIRKVTVPTGIITTIAGTGVFGYSGDNGQATSATIAYPHGINLDTVGNVYFGDSYACNVVRKITVSTGVISTVAGTGSTSGGYNGDNIQATSATLNYPHDVVVRSNGDLYICDWSNNRVRKVDASTGIISTVVGDGTASSTGDGSIATAATISIPGYSRFDSAGNYYITEFGGHRVRKIVTITTDIPTVAPTKAPTVTPTIIPTSTPSLRPTSTPSVVPSATPSYAPTLAPSNEPSAVPSTEQPSHSPLFIPTVAPTYYQSLSPHSATVISTIAGTGTANFSGDNGQATSATLSYPIGIAIDASDNVYICDMGNQRIRKLTVSTGIITTVAGSTTSVSYSGDGGAATSATLNYPHGIWITSGELYIGDCVNQRVRKVTLSTSIITTIAGSGGTGSYSGDGGAATSALLSYPVGVAADSSGNVYISDYGNDRIRKVTVSTGIISTIAGTGVAGCTGDSGAATAATIMNPHGITLDEAGNVFFGDYEAYNVIRKVTVLTGIISTVAGVNGSIGYNGDNIQATSATLYSPWGVALDTYGNVYISDLANYRIRKVDVSTGLITTVVGTGTAYSTGDGSAATAATVNAPGYSHFDSAGNYYIIECHGFRVRKVVTVTTDIPTVTPTTSPTIAPTALPSATPSYAPTLAPSNEPSAVPSTEQPSHSPLFTPTSLPTSLPSLSPTSSPTSSPTFLPTKRDNVAANIFSVPLTSEAAKEKIDFYLGAFVGYFLAIYVCLYLCSFLRYGKATATKLYDTSYQSNAYVNNSAAAPSELAMILSDLRTKNEMVVKTRLLEEELVSVKAVTRSSDRESTNTTVKNSLYSISVSEKLDSIFTTEDENKYSRGYRKYVQQQRTLLGCSPFLYPEGYVVKIPCVSREVVLPPGRVEDLLLFICHNHPLFSCFYFMDGSKLGAHGTRILYIGKDVAVFVLYQFSNTLLQYYMLDGQGLGTLINLFIITPSAVSIGLVLKYLYTCPFTETVEFQRKYAKYQSTVLLLGRLAILPIMVIMCGSLIIACLFSSNRDVPLILVNYFVYVQLYGIVLAIAKAMLLFIDGYYYQLTLFGVLDVLCIGQLYKERILAEQLVVDVDYAYRIHTYFCGLIKVQKILNRDDAIKAKWINIISDDTADIEMKGAAGGDGGFVVRNPLSAKTASQRNSGSFTFDAIHSSNKDEKVGNYSNLGDDARSESVVVISTENPIHSSIRSDQHVKSKYLPSIPQTESSEADDDAALYLEYQSSQQYNRQDDSVYDTANDESEITFEEWKTSKKQFKQGTRGSFVKAFQVFEEREQLFTSDSSKVSASVANTMHLQASFKVKNALATRSTPAAAKYNNGK